jgi:flagella basal body P-ring formation protein FlgA
MITFISLQAANSDIISIQTAIQNKFLEYYPNLTIQHLDIKPLGRTPKNFDTYRVEKITISQASLKRNHGTLSVLYTSPRKKKKRFFKFKLDATLPVYISSRYIKKNHPIDENYVQLQEITFKNFSSKPIDAHFLYDYESKRSIKEGKIITIHDVRRILDVKRGQMVDATIYDGNVILTFKVKTIEEGNIGDIIKVKRGHYKKLKAQIISKTSVDILE